MKTAARQILRLPAVLSKEGICCAAPDVFAMPEVDGSAGRRVSTKHTHGTGCTYSACVAAELAKGDLPILAKRFISKAIRTSPGLGKEAAR